MRQQDYNGGGGYGYRPIMRPPVQTIERINIEAQWRVPRNEALLGVGGFTLLGMVSLGWLLYLTASPVSTWVAGSIFLVITLIAMWKAMYDFVDPARSAVYGVVAALASSFIIWGIGSVPAWHTLRLPQNWFLTWLLYTPGVAGLAAGIIGDVRFIRELNDKFELTGREKLAWELAQDEREWTRGQHVLQIENERLKGELGVAMEEQARPLIRTDTEEGRVERGLLRFRLAVTQFLFLGMTKGFGRSAWVSQRLPAGLIITQAMWSYLCGEGGQLHNAKVPVFTKDGNRTILNLAEYSPMKLIELAQNVKPPPEWKPKL